MTQPKKPGPKKPANDSGVSEDAEREPSPAQVLARLGKIDDPMILYLLEMLIDRIADLAAAKERAIMQDTTGSTH